MKFNKLARLFIDAPLIKGDIITLSKDDSHYINTVIRKKIGDEILIFNGLDGEWLVSIYAANKKSTLLEIKSQVRKQNESSNIWLIFSPIKSPRLHFLIEKATELGICGFIPVITDHTVIDKINIDKINLWIKEAAEQSERLTIPILKKFISLDSALKEWSEDRKIILCNETEESKKIVDVLKSIDSKEQFAIMIGPEGGFSKKELESFEKLKNIISVQMGPRILRSDTAALAAISSFQATVGDWEIGPRREY